MDFPIQTITSSHPNFPQSLRGYCPDIARIFYRGNISGISKPCLGVVGSRRMTVYGERIVNQWLPDLARAGLTVVSGLAYGIDGLAHKVTLAHQGSCTAILGGSLINIYPQYNQSLAMDILKAGGCLISEIPEGQPIQKHFFAMRNRIIAALSQVLLVVEAGDLSGTFTTYQYAVNFGRITCAVPGDITREQSMGTNRMLVEGAKAVTSVANILYYFDMNTPLLSEQPLRPALTGTLAAVYDLISQGTGAVDSLVQGIGETVSVVQSALTVLEMDGYILYRDNHWYPK